MDRLHRFCLPKDIQVWLGKHKAPEYESAFAKDIPNSWHNHLMASRLAKFVKIRKKYRGSSVFIEEGRVNVYKRPTSFCHKQFADRFAIYER